MQREFVLSSFFAAALALTAVAQDVPQPLPADAKASPAPETAKTNTPGELPPKQDAAAPAVSAEPKPESGKDTAKETSPAAAAESIAMPVTSGSNDDSSLFPDVPKLEPLPVPDENKAPEPTSAEENAFRKSKNAVLKDDLKVRVRYRQARTHAALDPQVQEELRRAGTAATDVERREAWRAYCNLVCKKVIAFDPSLKDKAEQARSDSLQRISQRNLRLAGEPPTP